jgi:type II restriction enzyme
VRAKFLALAIIRDELKKIEPSRFRLKGFLKRFEEDSRFSRSVDKAYEIVVYALFNAIVAELRAEVTLSIDTMRIPVLRDFEDFAKLVLGVDISHPRLSAPARLFRVGTANANDAGLDMWANFGPAVQVKHLSLSADQIGDICQGVQADQVIVVCKSADVDTILVVIHQLGLGEKLRGMITEHDLDRWYGICCGPIYQHGLGRKVIDGIVTEMALEFPLSNLDRMDEFFRSRSYDVSKLTGDWEVPGLTIDV